VSKSKNGAFSVRVWTSSYYSTLVNPKIIPVAVKKKRS
jgi:hypothetical protein